MKEDKAGHGMHCNRQRVFDEISRWQVRNQPVKTATTWLLSRESGHEGQKRGSASKTKQMETQVQNYQHSNMTLTPEKV